MKVLALSAMLLVLVGLALHLGQESSAVSPRLDPEGTVGRATDYGDRVPTIPVGGTTGSRVSIPDVDEFDDQACELNHAAIQARIDSLTQTVNDLKVENARLLRLSVGSLRPFLSEDELSALSAEGVEAGIDFVESLDGDVSPEQVREYVPRAVAHQRKWRDLIAQRRRLPGVLEEDPNAEWSEERWALEKLIVKEEDSWIANLREILQEDELLNKLGVYPPEGF